MLRFGFKNRQKEMLGLTISEIRELRADLSVLKEQLKLILPEGPDKQGEELPPDELRDCLETAEGEVPGLAEAYFQAGGENPDQGLVGLSGESSCPEEALACPAAAETACGLEAGGEEEVRAGEKAEEAQPAGDVAEEAPADPGAGPVEPEKRRGWAVVDYYREKRPWWKFWDRESNYGRSV